MRKCFLLPVVLLTGLQLCAQINADSLHGVLRRKLPDTHHANALTLLSGIYRTSIPDSTLYYGARVMALPDHPRMDEYKSAASNSIGIAYYMKAKYGEAINAFRDYYRFAAKRNDRINMAFAINNEANIYIEMGEYARALQKHREALQLREAIGDASSIAMSYNNIGFIYKDIGDYESAASNFLFALREYEKLGERSSITLCYNYLAAVFVRKKDYSEAISYYQKAYTLQEQLGDKNGMGISLSGLGNCYNEQQRYDEALQAYRQARQIYAAAKDERQLAMVDGYIGQTNSRLGNYEAAFTHLKQSMALNQVIGNRRGLASIILEAANVLIELKRTDEVPPYLDSADVLIKRTGNKEHLKDYYQVLSKYHAAKGNYEDALRYAAEYSKQKDVLINEANIKSLTDMKVKYDTEKKEAEITLLHKDNAIQSLEIRNQELQIKQNLFNLTQKELALSKADLVIANDQIQIRSQTEEILRQRLDAAEKARSIDFLKKRSEIQQLAIANRELQLNRRNLIIGSLGVVLLLSALLGFSYYRRYRLRQETRMQAAILKQQELATRAVLEAEENERQRIAKDLHDGVGQMMSAAKMNLSAFEHAAAFTTVEEKLAFDKIISLVDESCREVRSVSHNMMPNALLKNSLAAAIREFIDKLDHNALKVHLYTEGLDERLDSNTETVLYRVIQECVNNVIKHSGANKLDISVIRDEGEITATIEDNGRGFKAGEDEQKEGMGLKNIRTRVEYLKGTVDFDSALGRGTLVALHIPL